MTDWSHLLGWSSPIGLGAFLWGVAKVLRVLGPKGQMKREMWREMMAKKK